MSNRHPKDIALTVKAVILDSLGRVLVLKSRSGFDDVPGGHVREGESLEQALRREVREETGLDILDIERGAAGEVMLGKTRTNLVMYRAHAASTDVRLSEEHLDWWWARPEELPDANFGVFGKWVVGATFLAGLKGILAAVDEEMEVRNLVQATESVSRMTPEQIRYVNHLKAQATAEAAHRRAVHKALVAAETATLQGKKDERGREELLLALLLLLGAGASAAYYAAYQHMAEEAQIVHVPTQAEVDEFVEKRKAQLRPFAKRVVDEMHLERARGEELGETRDELARRLDQAALALETSDAERVIRTEAQVAYGSAQLRVLKQAGFKTITWTTMDDEKVRESHRLCEEQGPIPIGTAFQNGLRYPGDPNGSPQEVINCRCWLVGVERGPVRASQAGHEFHGNQWVKEKGLSAKIDFIHVDSLETNPNEKWSDRYAAEDGRRHVDNLKKAIAKSGKIQALTAKRQPDGKVRIIDGQHRYYALKEMGHTHIGVQLV